MKATIAILFLLTTAAAGCDSGPYPGNGPGLGGASGDNDGTAGANTGGGIAGSAASAPDAGGAGMATEAGASVDAGPDLVTRTLTLENCSTVAVSGIQVSTGSEYLTLADPVPPWNCVATCSVVGTPRPGDASMCDNWAQSFDGTNCGALPPPPSPCICTQMTTPGRGIVTVSCVDGANIVIEIPGGILLAATCSDATVAVAGAGPCQ